MHRKKSRKGAPDPGYLAQFGSESARSAEHRRDETNVDFDRRKLDRGDKPVSRSQLYVPRTNCRSSSLLAIAHALE